ncbi:class I SAM-dependent methyltransferase [Kribbella deserti]|uniref:Class I SAM-dependent methyltransferase n=1 Tax=Kribbella deserti TaxID=1926257 RepID=A0ABV6QQV0_9ACTN
MTTLSEELRGSWESQQSIHAPDRELRFQLMLDHVEQLAGRPARVLDLACGPGSITRRVLQRFPFAEVVAIDIDPLLLDLARTAFEGDPRVDVREIQLFDPHWHEKLRDKAGAVGRQGRLEGGLRDGLQRGLHGGLAGGRGAGFDAVLTSTAMHWLPPEALAWVYAGAARLLRPGGVFANADHMPLADPVLRQAADDLHAQRLCDAFTHGAESCDDWYHRAYAQPDYAGLWEERRRRLSHWIGDLLQPADWHLDQLRRAGYAHADIIWRRANDAIALAVTPI